MKAQPILTLEGSRASLLRISLEIAVERFRINARTCRGANQERLAEQFDRQANEAETLLLSFCAGDSLRIEVLP